MALPRPNGIVTLLSDFGVADPYVGVMKGAVLRAHRKAVLVDVTHHVPPHDVATGSFFVGATIQRFPDGTVHVAVVDPGVGTTRRMIGVAAAGAFWIGPDNGLLEPLLARPDAEVRAIDASVLGLRAESRTFHGRDLFGPIAGGLASGQFGFPALGRRVDDAIRLPQDATPRVLFVDGFGNLVTNVPAEGMHDSVTGARIAGHAARRVDTYGAAARGTLVALVGSFGTLEVAVVEGSAYDRVQAGRGEPVELIEGGNGERR